MKTIWKFNLEQDGQLERGDGHYVSKIELPGSAEILSVDTQGGDIVLWAAVNPGDQFRVPRKFAIVPTGGNIPNGGLSPRFLGTVMTHGGAIVHHIFAL